MARKRNFIFVPKKTLRKGEEFKLPDMTLGTARAFSKLYGALREGGKIFEIVKVKRKKK